MALPSNAGTVLYRPSLPPGRGTRSVDKLLANYQMLGLIALLFPDARVLNCRRDPRDSGLSTYFLEFQRNLRPALPAPRALAELDPALPGALSS